MDEPALAEFEKQPANVEAVATINILGVRQGETAMFPQAIVDAGWAVVAGAAPAAAPAPAAAEPEVVTAADQAAARAAKKAAEAAQVEAEAAD
jgi:hypothetical protein